MALRPSTIVFYFYYNREIIPRYKIENYYSYRHNIVAIVSITFRSYRRKRIK